MISFETLYSKHYQEVVRFVTRKIGDPEEARDFTQTIFTKIFQNWSNIDQSKCSARTYLFRCVKNGITDKYTSKNRKRILFSSIVEDVRHVEEEFDGVVVTDQISPLALLIGKEYTSSFNAELEALSKSHNSIANLYFVQGYKTKEIAKELNASLGKINQVISRVRKNFERIYAIA